VTGIKQIITRTGLNSLYFTGAHIVARPFIGGAGAILMLQHVRPPRPDRFQPNRLFEVTPRFLGRLVRGLRRSGLDWISLDEMHRRMTERNFSRRFVCLTFDDGYRDVLQFAYPILKELRVPFAIYVPSSFPDGLGELWWLALEAVIAGNDRIGLVINGRDRKFDCQTVNEKRALYHELYWWLRNQSTEKEMRDIVRKLAAFYQVDLAAFCAEQCMDWPELAQLAADPLVTLGARTVSHPILAKLPQDTAASEMELSRSVIEAALGMKPAHLSYPFGDRAACGAREFEAAAELGFKTAVTARTGVVFASHRQRMTALPRIPVDSAYQRIRYLRVLLSGAGTALWNGFHRVDAT
jgi:peptidoglycan/xylan/chitin deacetylase (PgdA/CDA1 family)